MKLSSIVKVTAIEDFSLVVVFDDGQTRILNMKPFLDFGIFERIKTQEKFNRVHVAFDSIEWDCGVDLDPEFVMSKSVSMAESSK
jgi:hypothetical protein